MVIAWAELASDDLGSGYSNAAILVPRQLMTALSFVKTRYPSQELTDLMLRKAMDRGIETARKAVATARAARDLKALSIQDPARRAAELLAADEAIATAQAALVKVLADAAESQDRPVEATEAGYSGPAPVAVAPWAGHADGTLLPVVEEPAAVCAEKKLDLLVYGSIKPRGAFLAVELVIHDAVLGREIWRGTDYAFADGLEDLVVSFIRPSAEAILGRPYARVEFSIDPPTANLHLDGVPFAGSEILYFEPGSHEARAQAEGFEFADSAFLVEPGHDAAIDLRLEEKPSVGLTLSSDPAGAAIHIDGARAGLAPLDIPGAAYPRVARVSLPGYEDVQLVLRPESLDDRLLIPLAVSDGLSFDDRFDDNKGSFYRSLGWFVSTLPVTVLAGGLFQTYLKTAEAYVALEAYQREPAITERLDTGFAVSQTAFWAAAALSSGMLAHAVFRLVLYIGSAQ